MSLSHQMTPWSNGPNHTIWLKREDLLTHGSHKERFMRKYLKKLQQDGVKHIVLSTTGNAGICASRIAPSYGIKVFVLMSEKGSLSKAAQIESSGGFLVMSKTPVAFARHLFRFRKAHLLRTSKDESIVNAYQSLGQNIYEELPQVDALYNYASSGTSSLGIAQFFLGKGLDCPALHIAQSGGSYSIVKALNPNFIPPKNAYGRADTLRRKALCEVIQKSKGQAAYIRETDREKATKLLAEQGIYVGKEAAASFYLALQTSKQYDHPVVVLSGKKWPAPPKGWKSQYYADNTQELESLWDLFQTL